MHFEQRVLYEILGQIAVAEFLIEVSGKRPGVSGHELVVRRVLALLQTDHQRIVGEAAIVGAIITRCAGPIIGWRDGHPRIVAAHLSERSPGSESSESVPSRPSGRLAGHPLASLDPPTYNVAFRSVGGGHCDRWLPSCSCDLPLTRRRPVFADSGVVCPLLPASYVLEPLARLPWKFRPL